jgi:hypothetical protein
MEKLCGRPMFLMEFGGKVSKVSNGQPKPAWEPHIWKIVTLRAKSLDFFERTIAGANPNWFLGRTWKFCQKYGLLGRIIAKNWGNIETITQNIEKSLILDSSLGRGNFLLGRGLSTPGL